MLKLGSQVEVRCHPGCPWAPGWEIAEIVLGAGFPQYRVRRFGHARALSALIPGDDVRPVEVLAVSASG